MSVEPLRQAGRGRGIYNGPKTLSVMPTFTCPAECADCGTLSSPRDRHNLSLPVLLSAIEQAKQAGFANIVFTGGEPTLRWKDLLACIAHAAGLGLPTRIVTNAHWATSPARAASRLAELLTAGLLEINFSTGDEHVRFIPLERVIFATLAALERDLKPHLMVELRAERRVTKQSIMEHPLVASLPEAQRARIHVNESPWMPLDPLRTERYPDGITVNRENVGIRTGCDSVLQTYVLQADGRIGACCGLGMRIVPELNVALANHEGFLLDSIKEAEDDFLKVWIHYKGPEKILAWAAEKNPEIDWENRYAHRCQACLRLYQDPEVALVIREHYQEMLADVVQCIWLDNEHTPAVLAGSVKTSPRSGAMLALEEVHSP